MVDLSQKKLWIAVCFLRADEMTGVWAQCGWDSSRQTERQESAFGMTGLNRISRLVAKLTCGSLARLFVTNFDKNFDSSVATILLSYSIKSCHFERSREISHLFD
jgi:hypothetical protein